jgi:hypothetical protein
MKTTDKDIENMARDYSYRASQEIEYNSRTDDLEYGYFDGFKACEAKMLAEASAGVERWQTENLSSDQSILIHDLTERAFTAGAMSQAKKDEEEINHTMQINEGLGIRISKLGQEIQKLKADREVLLECVKWYEENAEGYTVNLSDEHKKHGFDLFVDMQTVEYLSGNKAIEALKSIGEIE